MPDSRSTSSSIANSHDLELAGDRRRRLARCRPRRSTVTGAHPDLAGIWPRRRRSDRHAVGRRQHAVGAAHEGAVARVALAGRRVDHEEAGALDRHVEVAPGGGDRARPEVEPRAAGRRRPPPTRARRGTTAARPPRWRRARSCSRTVPTLARSDGEAIQVLEPRSASRSVRCRRRLACRSSCAPTRAGPRSVRAPSTRTHVNVVAAGVAHRRRRGRAAAACDHVRRRGAPTCTTSALAARPRPSAGAIGVERAAPTPRRPRDTARRSSRSAAPARASPAAAPAPCRSRAAAPVVGLERHAARAPAPCRPAATPGARRDARQVDGGEVADAGLRRQRAHERRRSTRSPSRCSSAPSRRPLRALRRQRRVELRLRDRRPGGAAALRAAKAAARRPIHRLRAETRARAARPSRHTPRAVPGAVQAQPPPQTPNGRTPAAARRVSASRHGPPAPSPRARRSAASAALRLPTSVRRRRCPAPSGRAWRRRARGAASRLRVARRTAGAADGCAPRRDTSRATSRRPPSSVSVSSDIAADRCAMRPSRLRTFRRCSHSTTTAVTCSSSITPPPTPPRPAAASED